MVETLILVDRPEDFRWEPRGRRVITTREYIAGVPDLGGKSVRVVNLSRDYGYMGYGYYCSLLAEARGHRVVPMASTVLGLHQPGKDRPAHAALDDTLRKTIRRLVVAPEGPFSIDVFFGRPDDPRFERLGRQAFDRFRCPYLRLRIHFRDKWRINVVRLMTIDELPATHEAAFGRGLDAYTRVSWYAPKEKMPPRFSLAILHDPTERMPPSDPRALAKFVRVGAAMGISVEFIHKKDFSRLAEYDALFIRETTAIDHHSYRFARKAEEEDLVVIDDPTSILRCTNKVFLSEILTAKGIPTPKTVIIDRRRLPRAEEFLPFPMVLKIPDGSFSRGVVKVDNREQLLAEGRRLLDDSDIILAQEFMPTEFDWRVGVLNGRPLFVSQYMMARKHWQIYKHGTDGKVDSGGFRTMPVDSAPHAVVEIAVRSASLIGDGLYGVDIKETHRGVFVIEVNDNPNIDAGIEDAVLKDDLYRIILAEFARRVDARGRNA